VLKPIKSYPPLLITDSLPNAVHPVYVPMQIPIAIGARMAQPPPPTRLLETQIDASDDDDDDEFCDAADHFSDDDDDDDDDQVPEDDVSEMVIAFNPFTTWNNSEENPVEYTLPPHYGKFHVHYTKLQALKSCLRFTVDGGADWIGIYHENFTGFDEYFGWEYTNTVGDKAHSEARTVRINLSDSINLPVDGSRYIMMYFQSTGSRGFTSMLGISKPFNVIKRCPSPRPDDID